MSLIIEDGPQKVIVRQDDQVVYEGVPERWEKAGWQVDRALALHICERLAHFSHALLACATPDLSEPDD